MVVQNFHIKKAMVLCSTLDSSYQEQFLCTFFFDIKKRQSKIFPSNVAFKSIKLSVNMLKSQWNLRAYHWMTKISNDFRRCIHLFEIENFFNIINEFTVTFDHINVFLLNKSAYFFKPFLTDPKLLYVNGILIWFLRCAVALMPLNHNRHTVTVLQLSPSKQALRSLASSPPWIMANRFCRSGFLFAVIQRSSQRTERCMASSTRGPFTVLLTTSSSCIMMSEPAHKDGNKHLLNILNWSKDNNLQ